MTLTARVVILNRNNFNITALI